MGGREERWVGGREEGWVGRCGGVGGRGREMNE